MSMASRARESSNSDPDLWKGCIWWRLSFQLLWDWGRSIFSLRLAWATCWDSQSFGILFFNLPCSKHQNTSVLPFPLSFPSFCTSLAPSYTILFLPLFPPSLPSLPFDFFKTLYSVCVCVCEREREREREREVSFTVGISIKSWTEGRVWLTCI